MSSQAFSLTGGVARPVKVGANGDQDTGSESSRIDFHIKCPEKWHFFDSFLFSLITITTIGYGNQTPQTAPGQLFCVLYSIFGIPLIGFFVYYWTKGINHFDSLHFRQWFAGIGKKRMSLTSADSEKKKNQSKYLRIVIKVVAFFLFWYILQRIGIQNEFKSW